MKSFENVILDIMMEGVKVIDLPEEAPAVIKGMQQHLRLNNIVRDVFDGEDERKQEKVYTILRETNEKLKKALKED